MDSFFFFFLVNQIFISKIVRLNKKVYFANDFAVVVQHKALRAEVKLRGWNICWFHFGIFKGWVRYPRSLF